MNKRILLGALAGVLVGAVVGGAIGMILGGEEAVPHAIMLAGIGVLVGFIGGAIAADPKKVFGSSNDRELKRLRPLVGKVNEFEEALTALSDEELRQKTGE